MATSIVTTRPSAASRVRRPRKTASPPKHSAKAASTASAGGIPREPRKKLMVFLSPGPPNQPKTFCAPWAKKITPRKSRTIRSDHDADVVNSIATSMANPPFDAAASVAQARSVAKVVQQEREHPLHLVTVLRR